MDYLDFSAGKSSRRELQRPRPAPLKVHTDSRKIRKSSGGPPQHPPPNHRPPLITYVVSPKVIHTSPSEFMTLVQRLTGLSSPNTNPRIQNSTGGQRITSLGSPNAKTSTQESGADNVWGHVEINTGWGQRISNPPAVQFSSTERTNRSLEENKPQADNLGMVEGRTKMNTELPAGRGTSLFPGILSSPPASALPTKPPSFFSPSHDQNSLSFYQDLSPLLSGNKNYAEANFTPNHSSYFLSPHMTTSPSPPALDLFNGSLNFKREN